MTILYRKRITVSRVPVANYPFGGSLDAEPESIYRPRIRPFADRLYALRKKRGISHAGIARALGTTEKTVANWELDRRSPNAENIIALAAFFGVSTDHLLGVSELRRGSDPVERGAQADLGSADAAAHPEDPEAQPGDEKAS